MRKFSVYRVIAITVTAASLSACSYSKLTEREQAVRAKWGEVQSELHRRNDLVPNLIDLIKKYAPDEQPVSQALADSRARLAAARTPDETFNAANQQSAALARLPAIVENHPQLKADDSFNRLSGELARAELGVAVERMEYNALVQQYKTDRRPLSGALTAGLFNIRDYPFFEAPPRKDFPKVEVKPEPEPQP